MRLLRTFLHWGRCPQTPGIYRVPARMVATGTGVARPRAIPAAGSALGSHPCVALRPGIPRVDNIRLAVQ
jgi:hypothetical protein